MDIGGKLVHFERALRGRRETKKESEENKSLTVQWIKTSARFGSLFSINLALPLNSLVVILGTSASSLLGIVSMNWCDACKAAALAPLSLVRGNRALLFTRICASRSFVSQLWKRSKRKLFSSWTPAREFVRHIGQGKGKKQNTSPVARSVPRTFRS